MLQSLLETEIAKQESILMSSQEHFEEVWRSILPSISSYIDRFIDDIIYTNPSYNGKANFALFRTKIVNLHGITGDKYSNIFSDENMEEYEQDIDSFKSIALKKECDVIRNSLNSKSESLNDWKAAFYRTKAQVMYDTLRNILDYARLYNSDMTEDRLSKIDTIDEIGFRKMDESGCYLQAVFGTGIVSNITNYLYPRTFPGHFKLGIYSLYFISKNIKIIMPSETSEFLMVRDLARSKTGTIEADHNYFFPYETFSLYSLRIARLLNEAFLKKIGDSISSDFRYVSLNAFYEFVVSCNKHIVANLNGSDDVLKFGYTF